MWTNNFSHEIKMNIRKFSKFLTQKTNLLGEKVSLLIRYLLHHMVPGAHFFLWIVANQLKGMWLYNAHSSTHDRVKRAELFFSINSVWNYFISSLLFMWNAGLGELWIGIFNYIEKCQDNVFISKFGNLKGKSSPKFP